VLKVALALPVYRLFDYLPPFHCDPGKILPGVRLEVPFGKSKKIGFFIEWASESKVDRRKLKEAVSLLDEQPLIGEQDIQLLTWASRYYQHPLGEVFNAAFPVLLRITAKQLPQPEKRYALTEVGKALTAASFTRSPKQHQLWSLFLEGGVIGEATLKAQYPQIKSGLPVLLKKGIIQLVVAEAQDQGGYCGVGQPNTPVAGANAAINLNDEQQVAVDAVVGGLNRFAVYLLDGVTGSGKTEVYMRIIETVLAAGKQVLVLVPEINLTPQLEQRFRQRFAITLAISHSNLTSKQRYGAWLAVQQGKAAILLGTRSALFTPLKKPGLIILDEEHDASFKQQEGFRFSARDTAIMRAKLLGIPVLLGSATPSLESLYNAGRQRYRHLMLTKRAGQALEPTLQLLDIRNKKMQHGLCETLLVAIRDTLARGEQVMLFLNRRGFAPTLICHGCGWVARCRGCDANLVIHARENKLRCHHCAREQALSTVCPACGGQDLLPLGLGTERVEEGLRELFPSHSLVRLDRDSTQRKGSLESYLEQIHSGEARLILGTQMLAKGHHFPDVTLVAVIDVDGGLFSIDFHAGERLAQMLVQVAGRAGRADKPGRVILQTRQPEHPLLQTLIAQGYRQFAQAALVERREASLPPYSYQALLRTQATNAEAAMGFLHKAVDWANTGQFPQLQVLGPVPAPMEKKGGLFRYQLLFQSGNRALLQQCLSQLVLVLDAWPQGKKLRWSLDVDPVDLY
jgi:primosomal protein N' (replication factor Y) (superfamily II helicase)